MLKMIWIRTDNGMLTAAWKDWGDGGGANTDVAPRRPAVCVGGRPIIRRLNRRNIDDEYCAPMVGRAERVAPPSKH